MGGRIAIAILSGLFVCALSQQALPQAAPTQGSLSRSRLSGAGRGQAASARGHASDGRAFRAASQASALTPSFFPASRFVLPMQHPQGNPLRVELHVSRDDGQSWQVMDVIHYRDGRPSADRFTIQAADDGQYWFAVRTLFATHADPRDALAPAVSVIVDTQQPEMAMRVLAGGAGELVIQWESSDAHLDPTTLKIEYQTSEREPWRPVALKQPLSPKLNEIRGETICWPKSAAEGVTVRAEIMDRAGNRRQAQQWHPLSKIAAKPSQHADSQTGSEGSPKPNDAALAEPGGINWPADRASSPPTYAETHRSRVDELAEPTDAPARGLAGSTRTRHPGEPDQQGAAKPEMTSGGWTSRDPSAVVSKPNRSSVHPPVAYRPGVKASSISQPLLKHLPSGDLPSMTNSRQFEFDYDVDSVGRDGVSRIELFRTVDGGRTWTLDKKLDNPDTRQPMQVSVEREGVYGYRVVVVANSGLASRRPRSGDQADLWIGVDTTAPLVRLTGAVYGKNENAGRLAIRWQADDALFGDRPVTIRFSESAEGPWVTIASGLPNTGEYFWAADPRTPEKIFLRVEVRDAAGNKSADQLERAIKVEGLIPRGRIRGFRPVK